MAAVMVAGTLAITMTTGQSAKAAAAPGQSTGSSNGVNDGSGGPGNSDFGHSHQGAPIIMVSVAASASGDTHS